jgi:A/G-specific adenine glycosylase
MIQDIIAWYQRNKRDLPWRNTKDAYIIWLSEIILQQTRVEQGMPYFYRFVERYPTVSDFAAASEDEILKLWQGLGYYSRARNMHHTAQVILSDYAGRFPTHYHQLLKLKGIGEYTAAAIASFAGNEPRAAVDGNVFRVLSRYFGIDTPINSPKGKTVFTDLANQLLDQSQPGIYNQAMMEFGALQCKPQNPACEICPIQSGCQANQLGIINLLPVKLKPKKVKERYFNFIIARKNGFVLMNKRGPNDIWQNLHEFPLFETENPILAEELIQTDAFKQAFGDRVIIRSVSDTVKHLLSHQTLFAQFIEIENFLEQYHVGNDWLYVANEDLENLAQPKLIVDFFENYFA